jgi:hypothetical protein
MTEEEFRADLLAAVASRAEVQACVSREAFVFEMLERLHESGETPDAESCAEVLTGYRGRKLEIDAWATDEADGSLHLFIAIKDGGGKHPSSITLTEARDQGFNRLLGVFEQSRDGWLTGNIEESRPLWALARRIQTAPLPTALRLHVLTDRLISERLREIAAEQTRDKVLVTFQIWDTTRLKRIHDAHSIRDDLVIDFSKLPAGGLPLLSASIESSDYKGYLAVVPGEVLGEMFSRHGSRLLEGNVRTFLGRSGRVNKGIASTITQNPSKFFAFNNGIAVTASKIVAECVKGLPVLISATDLQIVNGAQTTASIAAALRDKTLLPGTVFVPMKLSIVTPAAATELIPQISRFANSQNSVRPSDFFANHEFHRRVEEMSRRILAPAVKGSQIQTHWYYERARGQHLNDQAGMSPSQRNQFLLLNPRSQLIKKTDLAKVECCFNLQPETACKGAEKAFTAFAEYITDEWADEAKRLAYGDDWFKAAVARVILFRAAESCISKESWYRGGYRAQIVAYTCARLAWLGMERTEGGALNFVKIWTQQAAGPVLERQIGRIGEAVAGIILKPPVAGRNISEWAKLQGCRKLALETRAGIVKGIDEWIISADQLKANKRQQSKIGQELHAVKQVCAHGVSYWTSLRDFCRAKRILSPYDEEVLVATCHLPRKVPTDSQAMRLNLLVERAATNGWKAPK